jgi:hypothetical protein
MVQTAQRSETTPATDTTSPRDKTPASPDLVSVADRQSFANQLAKPKDSVVHNGRYMDTAQTNLYPSEIASAKVASKTEPVAVSPGDLGPVRLGSISPTGDRPATLSDNSGAGINQAEVQTEKTRLEKLTEGMNPDQAAEAKKDMAAIEHRNPPLTAEEINSIYDSTSKLLEYKEGPSPLKEPAERALLAASILHNASLRHEIDQGYHNTCNVTTLEERLNVTNPAEAARIVSEVGLTGEYQSKDKQVIKLDPDSLHADGEARLDCGDPGSNGKRDYASQIFDMATINDYWQHQQPPLTYSQAAKTSPSDTGERLTYANGQEVLGFDGRPMRQPALNVEAMGQIGASLGMTGRYIISNTRAGDSSGIGTKSVESYKDFNTAIQAAIQGENKDGKSTSIIKVNTNDPLFGGNGDKGGAGGWHVVNASDYKAGPPAQVFITNQWGAEKNQWVNVSDLYNATIPPGTQAGRVDLAGNERDGQAGTGGQGLGNSGGQGRSDSGGQGQNESGRQGQEQGGSQGQGWSRNDGVIPDAEYKQWRQGLFHDYWKESDENPLKKNPTATIDERVRPLQKKLDEAKAREDELQRQILEDEISQIMASNGN